MGFKKVKAFKDFIIAVDSKDLTDWKVFTKEEWQYIDPTYRKLTDRLQQDHQTLIKTIKDWFQYNYTLNYEEYSCSKVELVGENTFRLIIPCSGEIKEMEIPTTEAEFMKFKKQHEREDDEYDI